jgi:hypothetical protein
VVATTPDAAVPETRRLVWALAPVAIGLLSAGLAAISVTQSFGLNEIEETLHAKRDWSQLVPLSHADASGSAYAVILKAWSSVGTEEWMLRAPSVLSVALASVVLYLLGARLFDRLTGTVAGVAFATSSLTIQLGGHVDSLLAAVLATWLFVVATDSGRRVAWIAYVVVAAAGAYVHASVAFVLVAHAAAVFWLPRRSARTAAAFIAVAAAAALPAIVQALDGRRHLVDVLTQPGFADVARAVHSASGRNVLVLVLAAGGVAALAIGRVARGEAWKLALLVTWAVAPLVGTLALSIARPSLDARYLAVSAPALAVLAAVGLLQLPRRDVVAGVALVVLAVSGVRVAQSIRSTPENWRAAATYALARKQPGDRVVVAPARAITAFSYYAGPNRGSLTARGPTVFVLVRATSEADAVELARHAVRPPAYAFRDERRFGSDLRVQLWERTGLPAPEAGT